MPAIIIFSLLALLVDKISIPGNLSLKRNCDFLSHSRVSGFAFQNS